MAINFIDITPAAPKQRVRTANDVAPLDGRIANDALPKIADPLPKLDAALPKLDNYGNAPRRRGRPSSGVALSPAEKQRRYRERKRQSGG